MKKLFTLALVSIVTAVVGSQTSIANITKTQKIETTLTETITPRTELTFDGHFPWQDSEYIAPTSSGANANVNSVTTQFATSGAYRNTNFNQTYTALTTGMANVTEITLNGRQCGEISIKTGIQLANFVSIPKTLGGYDICRIADDGFVNNTHDLRPAGLKIDAEIEEIGARAFKHTTGNNPVTRYQWVYLPNSLRKIGAEAFMHTAMKVFIKPKLLEEIGDKAFANLQQYEEGCADDGTTGVNALYMDPFPSNNLTTIGNRAFYCNESAARSFILPEGLKTIGAEAFYNNNAGGIVVPSTVTSIGDAAFRYKTSSAFGDMSPKIGGFVVKMDPMPSDWLRWFGDRNILTESDQSALKVRIAAFDTDVEFAKNKFYYKQEDEALFASPLAFVPDTTSEVKFSGVVGDFVLPATIYYAGANATQYHYKVEWSSSDESILDVTTNAPTATRDATVNYVTDFVGSRKGLAVVTRHETEAKTVKLTGKVIHPVTDIEYTKEFTLTIKALNDNTPDVQEPGDNENELVFPGPTVTTTSTMDWSWIWYAIAAAGALLLTILIIILIKRRKKDDNNNQSNTPVINF